MANCTRCGKPLRDDDTFCSGCSAPVRQPAQMPVKPLTSSVSYTPEGSLPIEQTVLHGYSGPVLLFMAFITFLFTGLENMYFTTPGNFSTMIHWFAYLMPLGLSAAITTRAKGLDFSVVSLMTLSPLIIAKTMEGSGSWVVGLLLALAACAAVGAINGALTVYFKLPALAVTAVMYLIVWLICSLISSVPIKASHYALSQLSQIAPGMLIFLFLCFAAVFTLIMLTPLGTPLFGRKRKKESSHMLAYIVSSVLGALSGLILLAYRQEATPYLAHANIILIGLVSGCTVSSLLFDNRFAPAPIALAATAVYIMAMNVLTMSGIHVVMQMLILTLLAGIFIALGIANWRATRNTAR